MKPTRGTWISAGVVAAVLAGGVSIAATASAGRIDRAEIDRAEIERARTSGGDMETQPGAGPSYSPGEAPAQVPGQEVPREALPTGDPDDFVVSTEVNDDPEAVAEYWTKERLENAEPLPMPVVTLKPGG